MRGNVQFRRTIIVAVLVVAILMLLIGLLASFISYMGSRADAGSTLSGGVRVTCPSSLARPCL